MTNETPAYETETCSRCHGSGHYSYNQMTGTTCFKCHGHKVAYTKRGQAAVAYAKKLRSVLIADVKIGDRIYWGNGGRCTVTAIEANVPTGTKYKNQGTDEWIEQLCTKIKGQEMTFSFGETYPEVRKGWTDEMVANVNAYQDALTKAGKLSAKAKKSGEFEVVE